LRFVDDNIVTAGPVWGFQRTYWYKVNLGLELGVGIGHSFRTNNSFISPIIGFNLGWIIK